VAFRFCVDTSCNADWEAISRRNRLHWSRAQKNVFAERYGELDWGGLLLVNSMNSAEFQSYALSSIVNFQTIGKRALRFGGASSLPVKQTHGHVMVLGEQRRVIGGFFFKH